jgi:hypothetical protein
VDMEKFIEELDKRNWGVASFNTYHQKGNCCFIVITEKGESGRFIRMECFDYELNRCLDIMMNRLNEKDTNSTEMQED